MYPSGKTGCLFVCADILKHKAQSLHGGQLTFCLCGRGKPILVDMLDQLRENRRGMVETTNYPGVPEEVDRRRLRGGNTNRSRFCLALLYRHAPDILLNHKSNTAASDVHPPLRLIRNYLKFLRLLVRGAIQRRCR